MLDLERREHMSLEYGIVDNLEEHNDSTWTAYPRIWGYSNKKK